LLVGTAGIGDCAGCLMEHWQLSPHWHVAACWPLFCEQQLDLPELQQDFDSLFTDEQHGLRPAQ
jgi:hypothetical protein